MTITEAIQTYPGLSVDLPDNLITKVLTDRSLTGTVAYTSGYSSLVELCAADIYSLLALSPDFSEGRLNIKYPRAQMINMARDLYLKNGETSKANRLKVGRAKDMTNRW